MSRSTARAIQPGPVWTFAIFETFKGNSVMRCVYRTASSVFFLKKAVAHTTQMLSFLTAVFVTNGAIKVQGSYLDGSWIGTETCFQHCDFNGPGGTYSPGKVQGTVHAALHLKNGTRKPALHLLFFIRQRDIVGAEFCSICCYLSFNMFITLFFCYRVRVLHGGRGRWQLACCRY